jgi:hypothetical protein
LKNNGTITILLTGQIKGPHDMRYKLYDDPFTGYKEKGDSEARGKGNTLFFLCIKKEYKKNTLTDQHTQQSQRALKI